MPTGRNEDHSPTPARRPTTRRVATVVATLIAAVALLTGSSLAVPVVPEPTLDEVKLQVEELYHDMEIAAEAHNDAQVKADEVGARLETLRANLATLQRELASATLAAGSFAAAQYRAGGVDPTMQMMLLADEESHFLHQLSQMEQLGSQQADALDQLAQAQAAVELQKVSIQRETARLDELELTLGATRTEAEAKHRDAQALLDRLTAEEEARLAAELAAAAAADAAAAAQAEPADEPAAPGGTPPTPPTGPRAAIAVDFALAQLGDAYAWGGAGPDSYDCSGLTMAAWSAAGVSLPHSSAAQFGYGSSVSVSQLQPGDLVFYYRPISHVAMYIGNGQIVHASNYSKPVSIDPLNSMPITGARRIG